MRAILHADKNWGIGKNNGLMFKIPADMKFFKETTTGNVVVMGSNTLKSFPNGKPLKDRLNIVLYPDGEDRDDCKIVRSLDELFAEIKKLPHEKVFVNAVHMMYKKMINNSTEVLLTMVDAEADPDAFFENLDKNADFELVSVSEPVETNGYIIRFTTYKNLNVKAY